MARRAKPWFRKADGWWYLRVNGKPQRLVQGEDQADAAETLYHRILGQPGRAVVAGWETVKGIVNRFIAHQEKSGAAPRTVEFYSSFLISFGRHVGPDLLVDDLRPRHVTEWIQANPQWASGSTKHLAVRAVRRAFRWAHGEGYIASYPLAGLKSYPRPSREVTVSDATLDEMLTHVKDGAFRDLLMFSYHTGCRPQEARIVTAAHVHGKRIVFTAAESKGKKTPRVIYLDDVAAEIIERRVKMFPVGMVFRNRNGTPWCKDTIGARFQRLSKRIGKRVFAYALRHSYVTDALKNDVDPVSLAVLIGHSDPSTLARIYQHLAQDQEHMLDVAKKAKPKRKT